MAFATAKEGDAALAHAARLQAKFEDAAATVAVIGMGYVGLPLALSFLERGFQVTGFDISQRKVDQLNSGRSSLDGEPLGLLDEALRAARFHATREFSRLAEADAILICVPTPLTVHREPDLSFVLDSAAALANQLRAGQLVVLESTTYPGTTEEVLRPFSKSGPA